jgi:hypothetical protein
MSFLQKNLTLVLNALYQPIGYTSIQKALISLNSESGGQSTAAEAMEIDYELDENGFVDFMKPNILRPVPWEDWITLPIRDFDIPIHTPKIILRAPIVIMAKNFKKMVFRKIRPSKRNFQITTAIAAQMTAGTIQKQAKINLIFKYRINI